MLQVGSRNLITDVDGIPIGNAEDARVRSGVSVVLCGTPSMAAGDVRGGAPDTRDTDLLDPSCRVDRIDAICLSGGSTFGLPVSHSRADVMRDPADSARSNPRGTTTIAVVATNATSDKASAKRLAAMAQDGPAHAIRPVHTPQGGDTVFAIATGRRDLGADPFALAEPGSLAADCLARAAGATHSAVAGTSWLDARSPPGTRNS